VAFIGFVAPPLPDLFDQRSSLSDDALTQVIGEPEHNALLRVEL